jgi:indole-3-glycerol phosphate synthase / phosphoribosylanthranilate isomerase
MKILEFLQQSVAEELSVEEQEEFLRSFEENDIEAEELAEVVKFLENLMTARVNLPEAIDVCGTGGSGLARINTSTISAFVLASLGVGIAKHGNRASSGRFGSFDLLEALGANFEQEVLDLEVLYRCTGLGCLFAPKFHSTMRHFGEVRRKIGRPTFFNLVGPLLNPAGVSRQVIGTAFEDKMGLIAETCKLLGRERVFVVRGEDGLDEVTLTGKTRVVELCDGEIKSYEIRPEDFGVEPCEFEEIAGGDRDFNLKMAEDILGGRSQSRHLDLVLVNAALALKLAGHCDDLKDGVAMARKAVESGLSGAKLNQYRSLSNSPSVLLKIVAHKIEEVETRRRDLAELKKSERDFMGALAGLKRSLIAEIKQASPSEGAIVTADAGAGFYPVEIAQKYKAGGARAVSVLCDEKFFGGSLEYLKQVSGAVSNIPLLCKDFIVDEYQIGEARAYGADAVLLIASILSEEQIQKFLAVAAEYGMDAICEVHDLEELQKALDAGAEIIGINNRNLHTFEIDLGTTGELLKHIPEGKIVVSESGFSNGKDVKGLDDRVNAILVGTALMRGVDLAEFVGKRLKICGLRTVEDAKFCAEIGVDFVGLNFVPTSKRKVTLEEAKEIRAALGSLAVVGVFQNQPLNEVNEIAELLDLDFIQLSGEEGVEYVKKCVRPVVKAISVKSKEDLVRVAEYRPYVSELIIDGPRPGSGESFNLRLLDLDFSVLVAGGVNPENAGDILAQKNVYGIDVASGIESEGQIDQEKILEIFKQVKSC